MVGDALPSWPPLAGGHFLLKSLHDANGSQSTHLPCTASKMLSENHWQTLWDSLKGPHDLKLEFYRDIA